MSGQHAESKKLIVAPWGNPYAWEKVCYKYENPEIKDEDRTSLAALAKVYPDSKFLIFVLDTVYAAFKGRDGCEPVERSKSVPGSYSELIESVERDIKSWIKECSSSEELKAALNSGRLEVAVVPGIGSYTFEEKAYQFPLSRGEPAGTFASWAISLVLKKLLDVAPDEVIVDLTHGLNYMPVSLVEAVEFALKAYAVATYREIKFTIYEAEPFSRDAKSLNFFVPKSETISHRHEKDVLSVFLKRQPDEVFNRKYYIFTSNKPNRELTSRLGELVKGLKGRNDAKGALPLGIVAANVILYSMPLAAVYLASEVYRSNQPNLRKICRFLNDLIYESVKHGEILKVKDGKYVVLPAFTLDWKAISVLIASTSLMDSIMNMDALTCDESLRERIVDVELLSKKGVSLSELKEISKFLGELYKPIADNELKSLESCLDCCKNCSIEVKNSCWPGKACDVTSLHPRNLRAHAGFERNIVEGKVQNIDGKTKELFIRYRLKDCWDKLKKKLKEKDF